MNKKYLISIEEERKMTNSIVKTPILHYNLGNNKTFTFIGTNHSHNRKDKQYDFIKQKIFELKPDCVIFERSQKEINIMADESKSNRWRYFRESGFIYNALSNNVAKIGGDIEFNKVYKLLEDEFNNEEINAYKVYWMMISELVIYNQDLESAIKNAGEIENVKITKHIKNLMDIYTRNYNKKALKELTCKDDLTICPLFENCVLSRIARRLGQIRDKYMFSKIIEITKKYNTVIFFAGNNHVLRLKKRLDEEFGYN